VAGASAAAVFALLSITQPVQGFAANAEHFVVLPMLGAMVLLSRGAPAHGAAAAAGLLLGLAYVMKQHALAFIVFGGAWVLFAGRASGAPQRVAGRAALGRAAVFAAACAVPFGAVCAAMYAMGAFEPFWFWTVTYASRYAAMVELDLGLRWLGEEGWRVLAASPALWLLAAAGASAPWWDAAARQRRGFALGFLAASLLAVATGWRFTEHYFLLLMPAASVLAGVAVSAAARRAAVRGAAAATAVSVLLPLAALGATLAAQREYLFIRSPYEVARSIYGLNPFPEAVEVARFLREQARPGDTVAVIGSEPQIYFYSRLPAATSYIYMYPLMEPHAFAHEMQQQMIAQLERARPSFLVLVNVDTSWTRRPESSTAVMEWAEKAVNEDYEPVGLAEMEEGRATRYEWGDAARTASPGTPYYVAVFRRRG